MATGKERFACVLEHDNTAERVVSWLISLATVRVQWTRPAVSNISVAALTVFLLRWTFIARNC